MAFLNSLTASSSQPRSASSMPRELCSSDCAMLSFSRGMEAGQCTRRAFRGARWSLLLTTAVSLACAGPRVTPGPAERTPPGKAPAAEMPGDGGVPEAGPPGTGALALLAGGDVTLGFHFEEWVD